MTEVVDMPEVGEVASILRNAQEPTDHSDIEGPLSMHFFNSGRDATSDNCYPSSAAPERLSDRTLARRNPTNHALFRIRAAVVGAFRRTLESQDFIEIHTPKLQASADTGAGVLNICNFGGKPSLTHGPHVAREMAIVAGFQRVYEIGPVFHAEGSSPSQHLAEYVGLDIEMAISNTYNELIQVVDGFLKATFTAVQSMGELQTLRQRWPSHDLVWPNKTIIIPYEEGLGMLWEDGLHVERMDLSAQDEKRLGELVRERYDSDYYILDRLPATARSFCIQKIAQNPAWTNSFDVFIRGQRICTGGQRIHDPQELRASMRDAGIAEDEIEEYLIGFDLGVPPHGGACLGLERLVAALLRLEDRHWFGLPGGLVPC
ncbi:Aspartate--tRNA ligase, cytoplasmic [Pleurostoma richardsiae]|uniref:aspartate--tRNA ligase n=1 Tax=Pleurostoma richardsiae TaxID=41990 RepID=A0AA38RA47_9PEZI|nr:Aspartate--tRNA ligase, cytoplasmic [Pleurostoma richardsiae]